MVEKYKINNSTTQIQIPTLQAKTTFLSIIVGMFALIVIAWLNNGVFTFVISYVPNTVRYGIYFAWLGLAIISSKRFFQTLIYQMWPLLLFYFYMVFLFFFIEINLEIYIKRITYLIMVYPIFLYYFDTKHSYLQRLFCKFLVFDCIVVGINTYIQLQKDYMVIRYLATGTDTRARMLGPEAYAGIGSYGYFYSLVAFILLLAMMFLNKHKRRPLLLFVIAILMVLLIKATYTIAILFTFIFWVLLVILKYSKKHTIFALILLILISLLLFQGSIGNMFARLSNIDGLSYEVSVRFMELSDFFNGKDITNTDFKSRQDLYLKSVDAFTNNILVGTVLSNNNLYRVGGHSAWLDLLGTFGLFCAPFFIFLFKAYKFGIVLIPVKFQTFYKVYWLYFICLGFINTLLFAQIFIMWFFFLPIFIQVFLKNTNNFHYIHRPDAC